MMDIAADLVFSICRDPEYTAGRTVSGLYSQTIGGWLLSPITSLRYYPGLLRAVEASGEQSSSRLSEALPTSPLGGLREKGWNAITLIPEFRCGNQYRSDFLLVNAMSGAIRNRFSIQLEPPSARLYTRNGTESKELKHALRQVKDWHAWADQHPHELREQIVRDLDSLPSTDPRVPKHRLRLLARAAAVVSRCSAGRVRCRHWETQLLKRTRITADVPMRRNGLDASRSPHSTDFSDWAGGSGAGAYESCHSLRFNRPLPPVSK